MLLKFAKFRADSSYVTESTKTGLIAYRQVLRKAGFNYSKCCNSPMAEARIFTHYTTVPFL